MQKFMLRKYFVHLVRLYYKLIIFTYYPSMRVLQEDPMEFLLYIVLLLSYILAKVKTKFVLFWIGLCCPSRSHQWRRYQCHCPRGWYASSSREPIHCFAQGLWKGVQEQHQERRNGTRVLQIIWAAKKYLIFISCKILV